MKRVQNVIQFLVPRIRTLFLFFCLLISTIILIHNTNFGKWRYVIFEDGRGYYSYLPALFIYNDPSCSFYSKESASKTDVANFINLVNGKPVNKYFCGEAVLQTPFFAIAHLTAKIFDFNPNGYSQPYQYSVAIAGVFYFLAGLFFLWKLLEKFNFRKRVILLVCICFAFGTNLFHYALFEPSMSHEYSFAAITAFLFFARSFFLSPSRKIVIAMAATLGIIALLRPVNLMILAALPLMAGNMENLKSAWRWLLKNLLSVFFAVLIFCGICFIQLALYKWQTGHFLVWSYKNEGFNFLHPHISGTLFSYEKGLFLYTPMTFLSLFGIFILLKRSKFLFISFLSVVLIIIYVISSWYEWKYGFSFGLRAYIDFYALFAFSFAFLIDAAMKHKIVFAITCFFFASVFVFSNIQEYQFDNRIIHSGAMNKENYWLVFMKTGKKYQDTISLADYVTESEEKFNDMEGSAEWPGNETIIEGIAHSGKHSSMINGKQTYSAGFCREMSSDDQFIRKTKVRISAWVLRNDSTDKGVLAISETARDSVFFLKYIALPEFRKNGQWDNLISEVDIPETKNSREYLKLFFIRSSGTIYIDDFDVEILPIK